MMIAEVILDLKNKSVDKPFSYAVPERFLSVIEIGERCYVDFSSFKRMGIIIDLKDEEPTMPLKEIEELIDIEPVLTEELIKVATYLSKTSCYPLITYLQTMIPNVLKVGYTKTVKLLDKDDFQLNLIFNGNDSIDYNKLDNHDISKIKEALKKKQVEIIFNYSKKESIKYEKIVYLNYVPEKMTEKRKQIVDYLLSNNKSERWPILREKLSVSLDTINRMNAQGIVSIKDKEVFRNVETLKPLKDKKVILQKNKTKLLTK